jgi:hypothetical protein
LTEHGIWPKHDRDYDDDSDTDSDPIVDSVGALDPAIFGVTNCGEHSRIDISKDPFREGLEDLRVSFLARPSGEKL